MGIDYREKLVKDVESRLIDILPLDMTNTVSSTIVKVLNDYEVTGRCTDIVPFESANDRLIKRYRGCLMVDGKSPKTIYQYTRTLKCFSEFSERPFKDVGIYDVRYFLACEKERGVSSRTVENTRANLSAFFQWMTAEEIIDKNPVLSLKPIKYVEEVKKPFSDIEIDALRSGCRNKKERALIEFLLATGVRVNELSLMKISDIDFAEYSVHVRNGKGGKERVTYITPVAVRHVCEYIQNRNKTETEYLFYNKNHGYLNPGGVRFILNRIARRVGINEVHPHRFRRTFATSASRKGLEIQEIQRLLGHSNINTTMQYISLDDEAIKSSYKRYITC